ncbi:Molybdenum cofactor biosynthesis protein MoaA [Rhodopirellula islandica]|uniref:GTP 3',8-cyclase n=1 Tax=Rhodopirellula islandica TaxID=595434 RepID=A0A0J1BBU8_RHOIS|nr:GTP 3',8-cyclase MoaA [Rhodopirellula islandica]KLU04097.1 Molybdenum cofactor biosynthesis protein MoaA [Rhodopirellula islandica]
MTDPIALVDRFGRRHDSLRISITDRCNIRCFYCMPEHDAAFLPRSGVLTFEEIERLAGLMVHRCGVRDIRITGGEPLVRRDCVELTAMLAQIEGLEDLSMTTNGMLLREHAADLRAAGLQRLNISLDTLDEATFAKITRRPGVDRVIEGIDAAIEAGFESIKLNALAIRGISESELVGLVRFAIGRGVTLRFIEFMPLDSDRAWQSADVLSGDACLRLLSEAFGEVTPTGRQNQSAPAETFHLACDGREGTIGIIRSVTQPFCGDCNRLRLTADGGLRNCLFAQNETPLRDAMRSGCDDDALIQKLQQCVGEKRAAHGIDSDNFRPPDRPMHAIGG